MLQRFLYPLLVVIAASSYGIVSTIIKLAMRDGFTASEAVTSLFFIGFCLSLIIFLLTNKTKISFKGIHMLALAGMLTGMTNIVYGHSLNFLPASLAVVLLFQFTWIGMVISCISNRQLPSRIELIALIILIGGTIPAAGMIDVNLSAIPFQGWLWGLAAALCYSLFLFVNGRAKTNLNTSGRLVFVSFFALIVSAIFQSPEIIWNGQLFNEGLWMYGLALGLVGLIVPVFLFTIAVPKIGLGATSILSAVELPIAVMVSVLLLSETVTGLQVAGIVIILLGMSLPTLLSRDKVPKEIKPEKRITTKESYTLRKRASRV